MVKLVDAPDSKSGSERSVGSSPTARTKVSFDFVKLGLAAALRYLDAHYRGTVSSDRTTPLDQGGKPAYSDEWRFAFGEANP